MEENVTSWNIKWGCFMTEVNALRHSLETPSVKSGRVNLTFPGGTRGYTV